MGAQWSDTDYRLMSETQAAKLLGRGRALLRQDRLAGRVVPFMYDDNGWPKYVRPHLLAQFEHVDRGAQ